MQWEVTHLPRVNRKGLKPWMSISHQNSEYFASGSTPSPMYLGGRISIFEKCSSKAVNSSSSSNHRSTGVCDRRSGGCGVLGSVLARLPAYFTRDMAGRRRSFERRIRIDFYALELPKILAVNRLIGVANRFILSQRQTLRSNLVESILGLAESILTQRT
ncbi:hypothetical protein PIB30_041786 [Stylosanthes scabra]|uniref:Uncharacterized protein n=1 Tax=Stylosanthes scabra TaxID=79078 RepID=A0ABU6VH56_9FABA|nr:hypothetical protein [Stylosanthes scabra]